MTAAVSTDIDTRVAEAMKTICDTIPARLNIIAIMRDAHAALVQAAGPTAPPQIVTDKLAEVLREIATCAVDEFTRRTGQPFLWVDEPDMPEPDMPLMSFSLDDKGNVVF